MIPTIDPGKIVHDSQPFIAYLEKDLGAKVDLTGRTLYAEVGMIAKLEKPQVLVCNEVRGGNHKFIGTRKLPGMVAWVASIPLNEGEGGGDVHFMSVCSHDLISRIALADVSGHGREVDLAAMTLHELMRKNIDVWGQSDFMRGLNDMFNRDGDGQYATAIVLGFHWVTGHLAFSNAGHLPPLWYHASDRAWGWLEEGDPTPHKAFGLPVGLIPGTGYCQTMVTLRPSDLLVLYTDGITDAENGAGNGLGREQLLEWAREGPVESPRTLGEQLLKRLTEFRGNRHNDDETLLVLQREKESAPALA
jgi:serine phosphatase RsbU (regulator of sigma subunit)